MSEWIWVDATTVAAIHDEQLAQHGGAGGVRDSGLLESALARPLNTAAYGKPSVFELATAYAFGIAKNHPFIDGNKRTAYVVCELFLALNGWRLASTDADSVVTFLALAASEIDEDAFADWLRANSEPRP